MVDHASATAQKQKSPDEETAAGTYCANGCGFFGAAATDGMCSVKQQAPTANWCLTCRKKVGLPGFRCRCDGTFCSAHRYSDKHDCGVDYKTVGREQIAKSNPP